MARPTLAFGGKLIYTCFTIMNNIFRQVYTVSELTTRIKTALEKDFPEVWVQGQITNYRKPGSGHMYFALKDEKAQLHAVMYKFQNLYLRFTPEDGMEVLCRGRISVYEARGEYQLILDQMEPLGKGALQVAFEQLKAKLEKEGLFAEARKRPIPEFPRRVAIITSPTGAVIQDMLRVIRHKSPGLQVLVIPSRVQGEGAAEELARALEMANRPEVAAPLDRLPLEAVVLARGGGSLEDLWAFNEEVLARAIAASRLPVISAVGHEVDYTIADFVADYRAATPTAAAEKIAAAEADLLERLHEIEMRMIQACLGQLDRLGERASMLLRALADPRQALADKMQRVDDLSFRLAGAGRSQLALVQGRVESLSRELRAREPRTRLRQDRIRFQAFCAALGQAGRRQLETAQARIELAAQKLDALSPLQTLARGYSIARRSDTLEVVRNAGQVAVGDRIDLTLQQGILDCEVRGKQPGPEGPGPTILGKRKEAKESE